MTLLRATNQKCRSSAARSSAANDASKTGISPILPTSASATSPELREPPQVHDLPGHHRLFFLGDRAEERQTQKTAGDRFGYRQVSRLIAELPAHSAQVKWFVVRDGDDAAAAELLDDVI